jgi:probable rRNA maturation factor
LSARSVKNLADQMLSSLELPGAELSVLLANDRMMRALNRIHRKKDRTTDVLAFPLDAPPIARPPMGAPNRAWMLGDVVISLDTAARQARARRRSLLWEVRQLLAHGLAHLLGYDHVRTKDRLQMGKVTRRLVRAASVGQPSRVTPDRTSAGN